MKKILLDPEDYGLRLDMLILERNDHLSRSKVQSFIKDGSVLVNGEKVKTGYIVREDDEIEHIELILPDELEYNLEKVNMNLEIIYEDDDLLVLNKPKDLVVHPASSYKGYTLVNGLLYQVDKLSTINGEARPGIVHRLDKDTSGLMVIAKSNLAHQELAKAFSNREVVRKYYTLVYGTFSETTGTINMPIKRDEKNRLRNMVDLSGREALSKFRVIEQYKHHSLLEVEIITGRTHQIRVHLSSINHPVLGDSLYGPKKTYNDIGQYLHSFYISFKHPITKKQLEFKLQLPDYFNDAIKDLSA